MKKKYLALVLAACMTASLAACGSTAADTSAPAATTEEAADTDAAESTEAADAAAATGEHGPSSEAAPAWEDYDARIAAIRTETDLAKREALMHEAEDELMSTWAVVPLYYYNDSYLQKTDVENIYANLFGFKYFGFAKTPTNTLDLQIASEPDKLDPALNSTVDGACLAILNFSGLFAYDENGQLVPELADSYEMSEDGMTYTFTMKDGLKWSDGEALDANDVLYSWNRLADENTAADYSYLCSVFATKDDGTLVTLYTTSDAKVTVENASFESVKNNEISFYTSQQYDFYVIGDLNSDEQVNSKDAAIMLSAYNIAEADGSLLTTANGKALMISIAKMNPAKYKLDSAKKVEAADGNKDGRIMNCDDVNYSDVKQLLNYAAATGAGLTYDVAGWHYGEYVGYVK